MTSLTLLERAKTEIILMRENYDCASKDANSLAEKWKVQPKFEETRLRKRI